ncbi:MAG: beta-galactosidase [Clostridia bacterium]|nr:beta-galactosidase [Clostridia bacterium]
MYFGADYYPEHWPREFWEGHAKLMKEAHFNVVRIGEFAWSKMEPEEGRFDFAWLDEAIEALAREGIQIVLGTPTASPPKWLADLHPDIYMKDEFGLTRGFGGRRHYCQNSPIYREYSKKIVSAMASRYKDHPHVIAWQIDNEFGWNDTARCYCDNCLQEFKRWLQNKYTSIDELNKEWGTIFWSQTYRSWDELILPAHSAADLNVGAAKRYSHNPGLLLDFYRFCSDSVVFYQKLQIDVLRNSGCSQPITHNYMEHFNQLDYYNLGKDLDFISWDNYVVYEWGNKAYETTAMAHDVIRGIKEKNFWVMEQQSGPCGWNHLGDTPKPGQLRLWTYQAIAHGAEGIVYFRWRACPVGAEQYWYGILDHDGIPRRRYREIQQIGRELSELSDIINDSKTISDAAIIQSYDNWWSHEFQPHNPGFDYHRLLHQYYSALMHHHIQADIVSIDTDLSKYKLVLMPAFNLMTDEIQTKVENYVKAGGNLIITFRSGTRNWNNSITLKTLPGYFKELTGVEIEEFDSLNFGRTVKSSGIFGEGTSCVWCDILRPLQAETLAKYSGEFYRGEASVTVNSYGNGKVYYIGCDLDEKAITSLLKYITVESQIKPLLSQPMDGLEVVRKMKDGKIYLFLLNHTDATIEISLEGKYLDMLSCETISTSVTLNAYGIAVLQSL